MWEKEYENKKFYWGLKPNLFLKKILPEVEKGVALDIGAGEGRNSFMLAKEGFEVEAVDKIAVGLNKLKEFAQKQNLKIKTKVCDINDFNFKKDHYSLIVAIAALDFLKKSEIENLIPKIEESLREGGVVYLSVFSKKDDLYKKIKERGISEIEKNTFYLPKYETYRHFFTKTELKEMFEGFKIINLEEKRIEDKSHDKPHFHNTIHLVAKKR